MLDKHDWYATIKQFCLSFVSLVWLDGSINFVFRFVAKISELLLAVGIVVSGADYLTHGRLMQNNVGMNTAWAWTQAIAIESSSGVVLLYALQARKEQDHVKMWLYGILAFMLALVGGVMLYTQIAYSSTGVDVALQWPTQVTILIAIARTFVSIAYVGMCRIKHVRLSGDAPTSIHTIDMQTQINERIAAYQEKLEASIMATLQEIMQYQMQEMQVQVAKTVIQEVTQANLIAIPKQQQLSAPAPTNNEQIALQALHDNPAISNVELARVLQVKDPRTAKSWRERQVVL